MNPAPQPPELPRQKRIAKSGKEHICIGHGFRYVKELLLRYHILAVLVPVLMPASPVQAEKFKWLEVKNDTTYVTDRTKDLTVRAYLSDKFAKYALGDYAYNKRVSYMANDNYNIGLGLNYKYIGLNVDFKMPFINNDTARYGKTKFFDVQSFIYFRKLTLDFYLLSYNGYYLSTVSMLNTPPSSNALPRRPDLNTRTIGANAQYIFNAEKFSFLAPFVQNEHQRKSAGSVMAGAGLHAIRVRADSAILPADIKYNPYFGNGSFTGSNIISLALNAGYAHTFVIKKNYFITAALLGGVGINYTTLKNDSTNNPYARFALQLNSIVRLAAGYSSADYFAGLQYINFINRNNAPVIGTWQEFQSGTIRLTVAKRFKLKRKTRNEINKIENTIKSELGVPTGATNAK